MTDKVGNQNVCFLVSRLNCCQYSGAFILNLILFILAGNEDNYKSLDEFEFWSGTTTDCGVRCPKASEKSMQNVVSTIGSRVVKVSCQ